MSLVCVLDVQAIGLGFNLFSNDYTQENRSNAVFVHTEYKFAENWNLTLAARYSDDESEIRDSCTYDVDGTLALFMGVAFFGGAVEYSQGGFGALAASTWDSLEEYKPEEVTSYELGFKSSLEDGLFQVNAAVYTYDYENKQGAGVVMLSLVPKEKISSAMAIIGVFACIIFMISISVISASSDPDRNFGIKLIAEQFGIIGTSNGCF